MKITQRTRVRLLTAVAVIGIGAATTPAYATYPVFDAGNAALAIEQIAYQAEQVAHMVEQIQNQIQSLQNQARMLQDISVSNYEEAIDAMHRIQNVLRQHCIEIGAVPGRIGFETGFDCEALIERFRQTYPVPEDWAGQSDAQIAQYPDRWNAQRRDAAAKAMQAQNAVVEAMTGTAQRMAELAAASQDAPGQKAAIQVTNQMLVTLSAQFRSRQAATLAHQRMMAIKQAERAAWHERNQELIRRVTYDAHTDYDVPPVADPFGL